MTTLLVLYRRPEGGAEALETFERRYAAEHLPLVAETPGLRATRVQRVQRGARRRDGSRHRHGDGLRRSGGARRRPRVRRDAGRRPEPPRDRARPRDVPRRRGCPGPGLTEHGPEAGPIPAARIAVVRFGTSTVPERWILCGYCQDTRRIEFDRHRAGPDGATERAWLCRRVVSGDRRGRPGRRRRPRHDRSARTRSTRSASICSTSSSRPSSGSIAIPDCRAIVLTGAGTRAFAAGADIRELAAQTPISLTVDDRFATLGARSPRSGRRSSPRSAASRSAAAASWR